jgi:hypothetical protein
MDTVNERSSAYITVNFLDKTGAPAVPSTVTYSTKCRSTGTAIKTDVTVTPAASVQITLDALDSAIQDSSNNTEIKVLTVKASYGANDECNAEYVWQVKNLTGVS